MPQVLPGPTFQPEHPDLVGAARTDGCVEIKHVTEAYGTLVVTTAVRDELVATGLWANI